MKENFEKSETHQFDVAVQPMEVFMERKVPASHVTHVVLPAATACEPPAQCAHAVAASRAAKRAASHATHAVCVARSAKRPLLHDAHAKLPLLGVYDPLEKVPRHAMHDACPTAGAYCPRGHGTGSDAAGPAHK